MNRIYIFTNKHIKINSLNILEQIFNNIGLFILFYTLYQYNIFYHFLISCVISDSIGFILFHNQHAFNPGYITNNDNWNKIDSGIVGSSFIQIPWFLKYFTGGIEYHHIHHIISKIPGYNLKKAHTYITHNTNLFDNIVTLSMYDCYNNLWLTLYDEDTNRYITFQEADKIN